MDKPQLVRQDAIPELQLEPTAPVAAKAKSTKPRKPREKKVPLPTTVVASGATVTLLPIKKQRAKRESVKKPVQAEEKTFSASSRAQLDKIRKIKKEGAINLTRKRVVAPQIVETRVAQISPHPVQPESDECDYDHAFDRFCDSDEFKKELASLGPLPA